MRDYIFAVWDEFVNFIGGRAGFLHWVLFLAALLACMFIGRGMRRRLFWPSVLVLVFFFNPLFYGIVGTRFLSGVYWRLLWMLPVSGHFTGGGDRTLLCRDCGDGGTDFFERDVPGKGERI